MVDKKHDLYRICPKCDGTGYFFEQHDYAQETIGCECSLIYEAHPGFVPFNRTMSEVATTEAALAIAQSEIVNLRQQIEGHCDRIAKQSELLTKRAEVVKGDDHVV